MFALFETLLEYQAQNEIVNNTMGYPCDDTLRYAEVNPRITTDGKYAMQILPYVEHLFADCTIVDSVEYEETEE